MYVNYLFEEKHLLNYVDLDNLWKKKKKEQYKVICLFTKFKGKLKMNKNTMIYILWAYF